VLRAKEGIMAKATLSPLAKEIHDTLGDYVFRVILLKNNENIVQ
jgi:hypothetical protein